MVAGLQTSLEELRREAAAAAAGEAAARSEAAAASSKAEAAEAKCAQLEKEADGLALDVASLQVGVQQGDPWRKLDIHGVGLHSPLTSPPLP